MLNNCRNGVVKIDEADVNSSKRNHGVGGMDGLILSIIETAVGDARIGMPDAVDYFASPLYQDHLDYLGLPHDWLPAGISLHV